MITPRDLAQSIRERIDRGGPKGARKGPPRSDHVEARPGLLPPLAAHLTAF